MCVCVCVNDEFCADDGSECREVKENRVSREKEKTVSWERKESELRVVNLASLAVKKISSIKRHFTIIIMNFLYLTLNKQPFFHQNSYKLGSQAGIPTFLKLNFYLYSYIF